MSFCDTALYRRRIASARDPRESIWGAQVRVILPNGLQVTDRTSVTHAGSVEVLTAVTWTAAESRRCHMWSNQRRCSGFIRTERRQVTVDFWSLIGDFLHLSGEKKRVGSCAKARWRSFLADWSKIACARTDEASGVEALGVQKTMSSWGGAAGVKKWEDLARRW